MAKRLASHRDVALALFAVTVALRVFGLVDDVVVMVAGTISATRKG